MRMEPIANIRGLIRASCGLLAAVFVTSYWNPVRAQVPIGLLPAPLQWVDVELRGARKNRIENLQLHLTRVDSESEVAMGHWFRFSTFIISSPDAKVYGGFKHGTWFGGLDDVWGAHVEIPVGEYWVALHDDVGSRPYIRAERLIVTGERGVGLTLDLNAAKKRRVALRSKTGKKPWLYGARPLLYIAGTRVRVVTKDYKPERGAEPLGRLSAPHASFYTFDDVPGLATVQGLAGANGMRVKLREVDGTDGPTHADFVAIIPSSKRLRVPYHKQGDGWIRGCFDGQDLGWEPYPPSRGQSHHAPHPQGTVSMVGGELRVILRKASETGRIYEWFEGGRQVYRGSFTATREGIQLHPVEPVAASSDR